MKIKGTTRRTLRCPACRHSHTYIMDVRESADGQSRRRRRKCAACGHEFVTNESIHEKVRSTLIDYSKKPEGMPRQLFQQHELKKLGRCIICWKPAATSSLCLNCAVKRREKRRIDKGCVERYQTITYELERALADNDMTRRDLCHLTGKRALKLSPAQATQAWYVLARQLDEDFGMMDVPKFTDLLAAIRSATVASKRLYDEEGQRRDVL